MIVVIFVSLNFVSLAYCAQYIVDNYWRNGKIMGRDIDSLSCP